MTAEAYGARLLAEVHEESLASLLSDVWAQNDPDPDPSIVTGFPRLDALIERLQPRLIHKTQQSNDIELDLDAEEDDEIPQHEVIRFERRKPVILHVSNCFDMHSLATTALIHQIVASSVLPAEAGGKNGLAVFIDCTRSFEPDLLFELVLAQLRKLDKVKAQEVTQGTDLQRVAETTDPIVDEDRAATLKHHDSTSPEPDDGQVNSANSTADSQESMPLQTGENPNTDDRNPQEVLTEAMMQHVHILECDSSVSVLGALRQLPEYLLNVKLHRSGQRLLRCIIICGIDNFYWIEREAMETARLEGVPSAARTLSSEPLNSQILKELKAVQARFNCPLTVYSTVQTPGPDEDSMEDALRKEQSNDTPLFNNYIHSALLTLQPFSRPSGSTLPHSFDGMTGRRDGQAGAPYARTFRFRPHLGGSVRHERRVGLDLDALKQLDLNVTLDEDNNFVFDL